MVLVTTEAVVLHAFDYLETSRIVRLATREAGVQSVIARGARRSARRFGAALDLFASGMAEIHTRPGRDLHQLTAFDVTRARNSLGEDLDRFASASMLAELALRVATADERDAGGAFAVLQAAFDGLGARTRSAARVAALGSAWSLVAALGFAPTLDLCSRCHQPVMPSEPALFSHADGGIVCPACAPAVGGGRLLPSDARTALRSWTAGMDAEPGGTRAQRAHVRLLREFLAHHLTDGSDLRAFTSWSRRFDVA
jgi:DNA repair protein RecO (recombination protein O)